MQVRAGGPPGGADIADNLTLFDPFALARAFVDAPHVGVSRGIAAVVADIDVPAVGPVAA